MAADLLHLILSFVIIIIAAELFTNGVEWLGVRLSLPESAVGSVLAAVGTALPETLIPIGRAAVLPSGSTPRDRAGGDLGRAVHARHAGLLHHRRPRPLPIGSGDRRGSGWIWIAR